MVEKSKLDLKKLFYMFPRISEKALGKPNLSGLEAEFKALARGEEEFSIKHFEILKDVNQKYWRFLYWWSIPELDDKDIDKLKKYFSFPRPDTETMVKEVCKILKNVEVCSCLLRFVDPVKYGILSPPVENLLNITGKTNPEKYLNYLEALEKLKHEYNFSRNADVDMALWTLSHILNSPELRYSDKEIQSIVDAYYAKPNLIKRIAARNALKQLLERKEEEYLNIADMFVENDHTISAFIAGREIERWLRSFCKDHRIGTKCIGKKGEPRDCTVNEMLKNLGFLLSYEREKKIRKWYRIRTDVVHDRRLVTVDEVENMVKGCLDMKTWK